MVNAVVAFANLVPGRSTTRSPSLLAFLASLWLSASSVMAGDVMFHVFLGDFVRTDMTTGQITVLGELSRGLGSMEFGPDGRLYGLTGNPAALVEVDTSTGAFSEIGTFPGLPPAPFAFPALLAITYDGRFFVAVIPMGDGIGDKDLYEVDPVTTEVTYIGNIGSGFQAMTGRGNAIVGLINNGDGLDDWALATVSKIDASVTVMQDLAIEEYFFGDGGAVDSAGRLVTLGKPVDFVDPALVALDFETGEVERLFPGLSCCGYLPSQLAIRRATAIEIPTLGQVGAVFLAALLGLAATLSLRRRSNP